MTNTGIETRLGRILKRLDWLITMQTWVLGLVMAIGVENLVPWLEILSRLDDNR